MGCESQFISIKCLRKIEVFHESQPVHNTARWSNAPRHHVVRKGTENVNCRMSLSFRPLLFVQFISCTHFYSFAFDTCARACSAQHLSLQGVPPSRLEASAMWGFCPI